jgi:cell division topological specificity factor
MIEILKKFNFWKVFSPDDSAKKAKTRLRAVLIQDQSSISEGLLGTLRREMVGVISRYLEIDPTKLEFGLERQQGVMALAASIPILRIKPEAKFIPAAPLATDDLSQTDFVPQTEIEMNPAERVQSQALSIPRRFRRTRRK